MHLGDNNYARPDPVLESLFFPEINARFEEIDEAYGDTCRWIFGDGVRHRDLHLQGDDEDEREHESEFVCLVNDDDDNSEGEDEYSDDDEKNSGSVEYSTRPGDDNHDDQGHNLHASSADEDANANESVDGDATGDRYGKRDRSQNDPETIPLDDDDETAGRYQTRPKEASTWDDLAEWLRCGSGTYWVNGKAGSGKSTLMSFIVRSDRTAQELSAWASGCDLCTPSYFFWRAGSTLQKDRAGLLRALLYQILSEHPELISHVKNSADERRGRAAPSTLTEIWTVSKLLKWLQLVINQTVKPLKICFFVDGLDEFEGQPSDLVELLESFRAQPGGSVKFCVSSRPLEIYNQTFRNVAKLRLQDLNRNDIASYIDGKLGRRLQKRSRQQRNKADGSDIQYLTAEIGRKAEGVFLWVKLAVQDVLTGLVNNDATDMLRTRVEILKPELEDLFDQLFKGIDAIYAEEAALFLRLMVTSRETEDRTLLHFALAQRSSFAQAIYDKTVEISEPTFHKGFEELRSRIYTRSAGLLGVKAIKDVGYFWMGGVPNTYSRIKKYETGYEHGLHFKLRPTEEQAILSRICGYYEQGLVHFVHRSAYEYITKHEAYEASLCLSAVTKEAALQAHLRSHLRKVSSGLLATAHRDMTVAIMDYARQVEEINARPMLSLMQDVKAALSWGRIYTGRPPFAIPSPSFRTRIFRQSCSTLR